MKKLAWLLLIAAATPVDLLARQAVDLAAPKKTWHLRFGQADAAQRAHMVWSLVLSADAASVVGPLGPEAITSLIGALEDPNQEVVEGSLWLLCSVPDRRAATACSSAFEAPPQPTSQPRPYYPMDAFDRRGEGTVHVQLLIDSTGTVSHAAVVKSIKKLDAAALHCARRWRFQPATKQGRPVPSVALAPVRFRIY